MSLPKDNDKAILCVYIFIGMPNLTLNATMHH